MTEMIQKRKRLDEGRMLKKEAVPLYYQLATILRKKILSGELVQGDLLPTEEALVREYGVSRITVRGALSSLGKDGLILRKRGKGTFVAATKIYFDPLKFTGTIEDLSDMGIKTRTEILDFCVTRASQDITDRLNLPEGSPVVRIKRLRLAEDSPYCYVTNYLPLKIGQQIQLRTLRTKPLLKILQDDLGVPLAKAAMTFEATIADSQLAPLLEVLVGDPLLKIERTICDVN